MAELAAGEVFDAVESAVRRLTGEGGDDRFTPAAVVEARRAVEALVARRVELEVSIRLDDIELLDEWDLALANADAHSDRMHLAIGIAVGLRAARGGAADGVQVPLAVAEAAQVLDLIDELQAMASG